MILSSTSVKLRKESRKVSLLSHPVFRSYIFNVKIWSLVLILIKNPIEEIIFSALECNTDTILLTHFKNPLNEDLIIMVCYQSNVFFLKNNSGIPPAKTAAILSIILVSHGEIIMENLGNAGKEIVPNNIIPSKLTPLWDFVKLPSKFSSFDWL